MVIFALITSRIQFEEAQSLAGCIASDLNLICGCCGQISEVKSSQDYHGDRAPKPTLRRQYMLFRKLNKGFRELKSNEMKFTLILFQDVGRIENLVIQVARKHSGKIVLIPDGIIIDVENVYLEKYPKYILHYLISKLFNLKIRRKRKWFESKPDIVVLSPLQKIQSDKLVQIKSFTIETPRREALLQNSRQLTSRGGMLICGTPLGELDKSRNIWAYETEKYINAAKKIGKIAGASTFIYRPHPGQLNDMSDYNLREVPVSLRPLSQDLRENEFVVTYPSTLVFEALSIGRDVYIYLPKKDKERMFSVNIELIETVHEDFWKCIDNSLTKQNHEELCHLENSHEAWRSLLNSLESKQIS